MSKKTLYQYYSDKDELVEAVLAYEVNDSQVECTRCSTNAKDAVDEIFLTMEHIIDQFRDMNPMVLYDLQKFHFTAFQKFLKYKNEFLFDVIKKNIERGIKEELFRPEINVDIISRFRLESMMIAFNMEVFPPKKYNLGDVTKQVIEHYLYGLSTLKGYKLILKYNEQRLKKQSYEENKK
jgi:AcrR family transcriptional regulator